MPRHWGADGPGGRKNHIEGVIYMDEVEPGQGKTMTEIISSLRRNGYDGLVDSAILLRNRQEVTQRELESQRQELVVDGNIPVAEDLEILLFYALGWTEPLRKRLEERVAAEINRNRERRKKPRVKRDPPEIINFDLGDPVEVMGHG